MLLIKYFPYKNIFTKLNENEIILVFRMTFDTIHGNASAKNVIHLIQMHFGHYSELTTGWIYPCRYLKHM